MSRHESRPLDDLLILRIGCAARQLGGAPIRAAAILFALAVVAGVHGAIFFVGRSVLLQSFLFQATPSI